jgi:SMI1-KNR4 cell-wall
MINFDALKQKYLNLYSERGLEINDFLDIENNLNIKLPSDFKEVARYYDGYYRIASHTFFDFSPKSTGGNIVNKTNFYRGCDLKLPKKFLALCEGDEDITVLDTVIGNVYWLGSSDIYNLADGSPLLDNPYIFPSFTAFFEYLLDEEEKERAGKNCD